MILVLSDEKEEDYERIARFMDEDGFHCTIAVHNIKLGPALGGCRIKSYQTPYHADTDAKLLAKSMTYKSSLAGLNFGGGKCVVNAPKATREIMAKVGECVNYLNGMYITAEDVGTTLHDIQIASAVTPYVVHLDGSEMTARGVAQCLRVVDDFYWSKDIEKTNIDGPEPVFVEGLGKVGSALVNMLKSTHKEILVSDIRHELVTSFVDGKQIFETISRLHNSYHVTYSPCALGQVVTHKNIYTIRYPIICGSANNQLECDTLAQILHERGTLYCPDWLVNAGGVIDASCEYGKEYDKNLAETMTDNIGNVLLEVLKEAEENDVTPLLVATQRAEERFM